MKIVLAFDSFKGSLTARQAALAARDGVLQAQPDADVVCLPLADGGEGTTAALCRCMNAQWTECIASDPLFRPIQARYAVTSDGRTAIIEMAAASGLTLLDATERNPMHTTTFGVGQMIGDAIARGCRHILIGIGGSATCDGGMGMLAALGARFAGNDGTTLVPTGGNLSRIASIDTSSLIPLSGISIEVICDVDNPLYGPDGAAYVYAMQKGAKDSDLPLLDDGLRHMAHVCSQRFGQHLPTTPGSGAAGGLGYALMLLGATLRNGTEAILEAAQIDHHLQHATLAITGEGRIDRQTLNGKLPYGVMRHAQAHHVPVIALAGQVSDSPLLLQAGFTAVRSITPPGMGVEQAMQPSTAMTNLTAAVRTAIYTHTPQA